MTKLQKETARRIFEKGAFQFGAFKLKLHEKNPDAPLSPFYINLRDKNNPKPGPLDEGDYLLIGRCILEVIASRKDEGDKSVFSAIAGIPRAADPIVDAMMQLEEMTDINQGDFRILRLTKEEGGDKRRIVPMPGFEYKKGERVILVDDLVTKADTKLEAIRAVESQGVKVVGLVVLVDRQQGGKEKVEKAGYKIWIAFTIRELLDFYLEEGLVDQVKYDEAINYISTV